MENLSILENATDKLSQVKNLVLIIPFIQECMYMMLIEAARNKVILTVRYDVLELLHEVSADTNRKGRELGTEGIYNEAKKWNREVHDKVTPSPHLFIILALPSFPPYYCRSGCRLPLIHA